MKDNNEINSFELRFNPETVRWEGNFWAPEPGDYHYKVIIQDGSGGSAGFRQNAYEEAGATIISQYDDIVNEGDIFLKVNCICLHDGMMDIIDHFPTNSVMIGLPGESRANVRKTLDFLIKKELLQFEFRSVYIC